MRPEESAPLLSRATNKADPLPDVTRDFASTVKRSVRARLQPCRRSAERNSSLRRRPGVPDARFAWRGGGQRAAQRSALHLKALAEKAAYCFECLYPLYGQSICCLVPSPTVLAHTLCAVPIPCSAGSLTSVLANDGQQNRMLVAPEVAGVSSARQMAGRAGGPQLKS